MAHTNVSNSVSQMGVLRGQDRSHPSKRRLSAALQSLYGTAGLNIWKLAMAYNPGIRVVVPVIVLDHLGGHAAEETSTTGETPAPSQI